MSTDGLAPSTAATPAFREQVGTDDDDGRPIYQNRYIFTIDTLSWGEVTGSDIVVSDPDPDRTYIEAEIEFHLTQFGWDVNDRNRNQTVSHVQDRFDVYPDGFDGTDAANLQDEINAILNGRFNQLGHIDVRGRIEEWIGTTADGEGTLYVNFQASFLSAPDPHGWEQPGLRIRFGGFSSHWSLEISLGQASDSIEESIFDPDGNWAAYVSRDGNCYIHDVGGSWSHTDTINVGTTTVGLDVSPDGAWIATTDNDGVCEVWETATWTSVTSFADCGTNYPRGVSFSRDNAYLAYALNEGSGYGARVVNTSDWSEAALLTDATLTSRGIGWSDSYVAVASRDTDVYVYNISDWSLAQTVSYPTDVVEEADFSQDGAYLVITGYDQTVRIVDTSDWSEDHTISVGYNSVAASFGYHDNWLAYGNHNGEAVIHEHDPANSWPEDTTLTDPVDRVYSVTFSQDEQWFAAGEYGSPYELHIYDAPQTSQSIAAPVTTHTTATPAPATSPGPYTLPLTSAPLTTPAPSPTLSAGVSTLATPTTTVTATTQSPSITPAPVTTTPSSATLTTTAPLPTTTVGTATITGQPTTLTTATQAPSATPGTVTATTPNTPLTTTVGTPTATPGTATVTGSVGTLTTATQTPTATPGTVTAATPVSPLSTTAPSPTTTVVGSTTVTTSISPLTITGFAPSATLTITGAVATLSTTTLTPTATPGTVSVTSPIGAATTTTTAPSATPGTRPLSAPTVPLTAHTLTPAVSSTGFSVNLTATTLTTQSATPTTSVNGTATLTTPTTLLTASGLGLSITAESTEFVPSADTIQATLAWSAEPTQATVTWDADPIQATLTWRAGSIASTLAWESDPVGTTVAFSSEVVIADIHLSN